MPIHEFHCDTCGADFEKLIRSSTNDTEVVCPHCSSGSLTRKFSTFACASGSSTGTGANCTPGGG